MGDDIDMQKNIEHYSASVADWYDTQLEHDKSLLTLFVGQRLPESHEVDVTTNLTRQEAKVGIAVEETRLKSAPTVTYGGLCCPLRSMGLIKPEECMAPAARARRDPIKNASSR